MECLKEDHMVRLKEGKFKDSEQFVFCKLLSSDSTSRPEIHGFTDASLMKPKFTVKVKSFVPVKAYDQVPQIVKARYDDYICIRGEGGSTTYLRTDNRKQKDEWCAILGAIFEQDISSRYSTRPRRSTDAGSNRPPPRRGRKNGDPMTAPPSAKGIFHKELEDISEGKNCGNFGDDGDVLCCPKHHEASFHHDGRNMVEHDEVIYENVHYVHNETQWKAEKTKNRNCLLQSGQLYSDYHALKNEQGDEDTYEEPMPPPGGQKQPVESRWSDCSTSSEKSSDGLPQPLRPSDGVTVKIPVEASWPNSPENSPDQSADLHCSRLKPDVVHELEEKLNIHWSEKEPEARLFPSKEWIYENTDVKQPQMRIGLSLTTKNPRTLPPKQYRSTKDRRPPKISPKPPIAKCQAPPIPTPRSSSLNLADRGRKLKSEKMNPNGVKVEIDKAVLLRNMPTLRQKHDAILVTSTSPAVQNVIRIGDQIIKVNSQLLNSAEFAKTCMTMTDKQKVVLTLKRIPFGNVCNFERTSDELAEIGLEFKGPQITGCRADGLAATQGHLQSTETTSFNTAGVRCNYAITEINMKPVDPNASTEKVKEMLRKAGREIVLILHPVDFQELQSSPEDECVYEDLY